jgi:hypothetical protein
MISQCQGMRSKFYHGCSVGGCDGYRSCTSPLAKVSHLHSLRQSKMKLDVQR